MGGKRLVFQKKLVKISSPLMGKLLKVATPMVQVKIEPFELPNPGDFEEVTIDGASSCNNVAPKKKHDFIVYMCKSCKMYFPVRQMLENHNAKVHAPQKSPVAVVSRVTNKVVQQVETIVSPPKKRQKRLQSSVLKPKERPAQGEDRIYFTSYYKLSSGDYVCSSCNFSSRIRTTVASHAARKHNSSGFENKEKSLPFKAPTEEESNTRPVEEDDEGSWPVEVVEEEVEEESEKDPLAENPGRSCPHCPFVSSIGSTYHSHIKRKHREQWLKSVANRVAILKPSSATNTVGRQLNCAFCPFKSFKRSTMCSHVIRKHKSTDPLKDDPELADMQAQTEGKKVRKCPYCPFESWVYSTMNSHITRNHGDQPHPLFSKSKPRYNMQLFTGYACHYCSFAGATVMSIRSHTAREHTGRKQPLQQVPVKEFDCDQCDYKTKSRRYMQQHLKDCHTMLANTEGMFQCHACSYETQSRMGLQRHVSIKHSVLPSKNISDSAYFKCDQCDYKTLNSKIMDWHMRQHSEENDGENDGKSYECNECDFSTWTKSQLYQHIRRKHKDGEGNEKEQEAESEQVYTCGQCDYVSKNKHAMKTHVLRKHTDDYPHECSLCEKKYKVKADLTNHIRFQHREQPIICEVCGKTCRNSNLLYLHQKFAHYKPDFECHICHRRMVSQANLDDHILKQHEQVEESVCEECGKTFRKAARLKIHMRVHTGVKPYSCKICMKSFARRNGLRQHLLIHTGKRPYICDICGKSFTQKTGLICHRKMHPGDKPPLPRVTIEHVLTDLLLPKRIIIESREEPVDNYDYSSSDIEFEEVTIDGSSFSTPTESKDNLKVSKSSDKKIVSSRKSVVYMCKPCNLIFSGFNSLERHFGSVHRKKVKKPESVLTDCETARVTKLHRAPGQSVVARWRALPTESIATEELDIKPIEEVIISDDEEQVVVKEVPIVSAADDVSENLVEGDAEMVQEADKLLDDVDFDGDLIEEDNDGYVVEEVNEVTKYEVHSYETEDHEALQNESKSQAEFPCSICDSVCRNRQALKMHFLRNHSNRYEHQCKFCPKKFNIKGDLSRHVRFKHENNLVNCNLCGKIFNNSRSLFLHLKTLHNKPKLIEEQIVCGKCGKSLPKFQFRAHMDNHTRTLSSEKPYFCIICNKTFATRVELRRHLKLIHSDKKKFDCYICGKLFTQEAELINHRKTHLNKHDSSLASNQAGNSGRQENDSIASA